MTDTNRGAKPAAARPYYETLGQGCDAIVRCHDCGRLVTHATLASNRGTTPCCGTRKVREARGLTAWEWLKVRTGMLQFPYRAEFLREFGPSFPWLRKLVSVLRVR